ncbi:MAG: signal peptidase II [Hyphomicrobiaceae bacterium]|nr:MAG: signal peptidase II [Hyphomicrobiaceae bacterium]
MGPLRHDPRGGRRVSEAAPLGAVRRSHFLAGFLTLVLTGALDQIHKWWMIEVYRIGEKGRVRVTPFLDLVYVQNKGISYSLLDGLGQGPLIAVAVLAMLALLVWIARAENRPLAVSLGLIAGGAVGNAVDRVRLGGVADFFLFYIKDVFSWYVFNLADVAIVAGVVGLLYEYWSENRKNAGKST